MSNPRMSGSVLRIALEYLYMTACCAGVCVVIHLFQLPNHFVFGGVTGLAVLLSTATGLPFALLNILINGALLLAGFLFLGRDFGIRTVYVTLCVSVCFEILARTVPIAAPLTTEPILEGLAVIVAMAAMSAALFQVNACGGGTDIAAMIIRRYWKVDIGKAMLSVDLASVLFSFPLYGITTGLFSLFGLLAKVFVMDTLLESIHLCKYFTIVTSDPEPICAFIRGGISRGATVFQARGNFAGEERTVILTAVRRSQAIRLRNFIHANAPDAFLVITNTSEIIGRGFLVE